MFGNSSYVALIVFLIGYIIVRNVTYDEISLGYTIGGLTLALGILIGCFVC